MNKRQFLSAIVLASILGGFVSVGTYRLLEGDRQEEGVGSGESMNTKFTNFMDSTSYIVPEGLNFVHAAEITTPSVVHIQSSFTADQQVYRSPLDDFFRDFWGEGYQQPRRRKGQSSGSGVIISTDGYIVTNNHVVENAEELNIILSDNREYEAKIIGTDPTTDIALIKIEANDLPYIEFGNSDVVKIGEWVLAVGNPFNLTSTVTAGIVSAKARSINLLRRSTLSIESFIQTDAAVNPGNSGGALVNLNGQLIGINTAIATPTGSYAGYSFAVPSSLVRKVVNDLREYGVVQRALLGVNIKDITPEIAKDNDMDEIRGIVVENVQNNSAADEAGLRKGDIILEVNGVEVSNVSELQEQVARYRPGDEVSVVYIRSGAIKKTDAILKNNLYNTEIVKKDNSVTMEGVVFNDLEKEKLDELEIESGVEITEIGDGKFKNAGIKEGFIITRVAGEQITNVEGLIAILNNIKGSGGILIEGIYPDGEKAYYGLGW